MEKGRVQSFEDLIVWQKSHTVWQMVCEDCQQFQSNKIAWTLSDQVLRSSGSMSANIAEGCGSGYTNEFIRLLRIARKESYETLNWLIKAKDLKYITSERLTEYRNLIDEVIKMINVLIKRLNEKL